MQQKKNRRNLQDCKRECWFHFYQLLKISLSGEHFPFFKNVAAKNFFTRFIKGACYFHALSAILMVNWFPNPIQRIGLNLLGPKSGMGRFQAWEIYGFARTLGSTIWIPLQNGSPGGWGWSPLLSSHVFRDSRCLLVQVQICTWFTTEQELQHPTLWMGE